jgi:RNA polymerase sigma-70 factor (ECF subfamily)
LFTIARSKLIDAERRGRVAAEARKRLALEPIDFEDDDLRRVIELADLDQQRSRVVSLIDDLPQDQREALLARFVDDLNYEEIAGSSASAQAAVRKRVSRALGTLRRRWIEDGP